MGSLFTPPVISNIDGPLGTLLAPSTGGGTNWPGGSFDPERRMNRRIQNTQASKLAQINF